MMDKVLVVGYIGFQNFGDEALVSVLIRDLLKANFKRKDILVLSNDPAQTSPYHNISSKNRWNILDVVDSILKSDVLVFIGGLFQDKTSFKSFLYYAAILLFAAFCRKKIVFYATGIGPFISKTTKSIFDFAVSYVDFITVRDNTSANYLIHGEHALVTIDAVWSIEADLKVHKKINFINWNHPIIGVSMKYDKNLSLKHINFFAEKLSKVVHEMNDWQILFIPCMLKEDLNVSYDLYDAVLKKSNNKNNIHILDQFNKLSVQEQVGIFASCDVVFGMRYHSLLVPLAFGKPVLGITCDPKIKSLMEISSQVSFSLKDDPEQPWNYFWQNLSHSRENAKNIRERALKLHKDNQDILISLKEGSK